MSVKNANRWRCLTVGCNPKLYGEQAANDHNDATGHRVAKWPVRSEEGKRRARIRNKTGYYDKYNTGHKSWSAYQGRKARGRSRSLPFMEEYMKDRARGAIALSPADMSDNGYGDDDDDWCEYDSFEDGYGEEF